MVIRTDQTDSSENPLVSNPPLDIKQVIRDHYQTVYRYAYRLSGCGVEAEDLTQQAFLLAHRNLHQVRDTSKVDRWLFTVLRSCFLKSRRRERPVAAAVLELNVDEVAEQADQPTDLDPEALQLALDRLPDDYRTVVVMYYFEEMSYKEIAAQLEVPLGTVMSRLSRAKTRLRSQLGQPTSGSDSTISDPSL